MYKHLDFIFTIEFGDNYSRVKLALGPSTEPRAPNFYFEQSQIYLPNINPGHAFRSMGKQLYELIHISTLDNFSHTDSVEASN